MTFKNYLNENQTLEESSDEIINFINKFYIPVSPKFWEELFGVKETFAFVSMEPYRASSLIQRQNKKNQISAFTDYKSTSIFWGANDLEWGRRGDDTVIAVIKGKYTLKTSEDSYSEYEKAGRKWIDPNSIAMLYSIVNTNKQQKMLYDTFVSIRRDIEDLVYSKYDSDFINELNNKDNKTKQKVIKDYFDMSYEVIKKYKKELIKISKNKTTTYNEIYVYDYEIKEFIIFTDDKDYFEDNFKDELKVIKKYPFVITDKINDIKTTIKKYQKLKA